MPQSSGAPNEAIVFTQAHVAFQRGDSAFSRHSNETTRPIRQHEDEEQREVEAREHRRVPHGKGREGGATGDDEPDLVPVPDGPDRLEHRRPVGLVPADDGQQRADAEVEALEHEIARPENAEQAEPGDLERPC